MGIRKFILTMLCCFVLFLQSCLLDVTSVVAPGSVTTGSVMTVTVNGTTAPTGISQKGFIVLQVPAGTTVLRVHGSFKNTSQFMTETPVITTGYTAEPGYQLSGWVTPDAFDDYSGVTFKIWLLVPYGVSPGNYTIKAAVGVSEPWVPQNPQINGTPTTNFFQISGNYASNPITISEGAPDSTPPADVTPSVVSSAVYDDITVDISTYDESAQGDIVKYRIHVSKESFNSTAGRQLLNSTTIPSVTGISNNSPTFSSEIGTGLFYFEVPPGTEHFISIRGLTSLSYYFAVTAVDVSGNESSPIVVPLFRGSLSGKVTNGTTGVQRVRVEAIDSNCSSSYGAVYTGASGNYTIFGLPVGSYKISFVCSSADLLFPCSGGYLTEWYNDKINCVTADAVPVTAETTGIDAVLALGGSISGTVTSGTTGLAYIEVSLFDSNCNQVDNASTDANGNYTITGLSTGSYKVQFLGDQGYLSEWYNDKIDCVTADAVPITAGETTEGIDAVLTFGGSISGTVTNGTTGVQMVTVSALDSNCNQAYGTSYTDASGNYTVYGLPPGSYKIQFLCTSSDPFVHCTGGYLTEWYNNKTDCGNADAIVVKAGDVTSGIDALLSQPAQPTIEANNTHLSISLRTIDRLSVSVSLHSGAGPAEDADWWVAANTPMGWHYYIYPSQWFYAGDLANIKPAYQGPLFNLAAMEVLNITGLPTGAYTFYFGVDTKTNGIVDYDILSLDYVSVIITP